MLAAAPLRSQPQPVIQPRVPPRGLMLGGRGVPALLAKTVGEGYSGAKREAGSQHTCPREGGKSQQDRRPGAVSELPRGFRTATKWPRDGRDPANTRTYTALQGKQGVPSKSTSARKRHLSTGDGQREPQLRF